MNLTESHYLEKPSYNITLSQGQQAEFDFKIMTRQRRVKVIKEGGTLSIEC